MIRTLHEGILADGITVPLTKLRTWFGVPRQPHFTAAAVNGRTQYPLSMFGVALDQPQTRAVTVLPCGGILY